MKTCVILVSHSEKIAEGLKEMIDQMVGHQEAVTIVACGGTEDGRIGTSAPKILEAIEAHQDYNQIYLFGDLGSGLISLQMALDLVEDEALRAKCHYISGPLVEGGFAGSVQCLVDPSFEAVKREVENCLYEAE